MNTNTLPPPNWKPVKVALKDLKPWSKNPRRMSRARARRLLESFERFGQVQPIVIGPEGDVYDGHQRLDALSAAHGLDHQVLALQSDRPLTEEERQDLVLLLHAGATGAWDWSRLLTWDLDKLVNLGFDKELMNLWYDGALAIEAILEEHDKALREAVAGKDAALVVAPVTGAARSVHDETVPEYQEPAPIHFTREDVVQAESKIQDKTAQPPKNYVDVVCPHCGKTFAFEVSS